MIFLDTNIFIRYFEQEEGNEVSARTSVLFTDIVGGQISCFTNTMVITEIIWVLEKYYNWPKEEVCDNIDFILNTPNIKIRERSILQKAVSVYRINSIDFIDAYNYSYIKSNNASAIYSYDLHFDKLSDIYSDIIRVTP